MKIDESSRKPQKHSSHHQLSHYLAILSTSTEIQVVEEMAANGVHHFSEFSPGDLVQVRPGSSFDTDRYYADEPTQKEEYHLREGFQFVLIEEIKDEVSSPYGPAWIGYMIHEMEEYYLDPIPINNIELSDELWPEWYTVDTAEWLVHNLAKKNQR